MVSTLELACYSSVAAAALAYLAHKVTDGQSTLPIEVDGKMVFVPKALVDILFDLSKFSHSYNNTISKIHEGPPPPEDQYALVVQADRKCRVYVPYTRLVVFGTIRDIDMNHRVRNSFSALYDRVTTTCANGGEVEDDLLAYREEQRLRINEIEVSMRQLGGDSCDDLNDLLRNCWEVSRHPPAILVTELPVATGWD